METTKCPRCSGLGTIQGYVALNGGQCYECDGLGTIEVAVIARRAKVNAKAAAKRESARIARLAARDIEHAARMEAFAVENPDLAMRLDAMTGEVGSYTKFAVADGKVCGDVAEYVERVLRSVAA